MTGRTIADTIFEEIEGIAMAVDSGEGMDVSKRTGRSRRHGWKWFWRSILIFLLAGAICLVFLRHHWRAEFHARIEAIRAAGFPVTGQELDAWYPWSRTGENAANWITGAYTFRQKPDPNESKAVEAFLGAHGGRPHATEAVPADLVKLLKSYIGNNSKSLASLHEAASMAEARYPVNFSGAPDDILLPHLSSVSEGCRLLCLEAMLLAEHGDPQGAVRSIEAVLHVAQSLEQEPLIISHLVRMIGADVATIALERALNLVEFPASHLAKLQAEFQAIRPNEGLLRAVVGSRCILLAILSKPQAIDRDAFGHLPPVPLLEAYEALGLCAREGVIVLDYMEECRRIAQLPTFERPAAIRAAETLLRGRKGIFLREAAYLPGQIGRVTQEAAWIGVAATSLAVERYRLAHTRLPEALGDLAPTYLAEVPQDPYDGVPMRYLRTDRGFAVYSVGEDGKDDGGKARPPKGQGETYDLVFRVERRS